MLLRIFGLCVVFMLGGLSHDIVFACQLFACFSALQQYFSNLSTCLVTPPPPLVYVPELHPFVLCSVLVVTLAVAKDTVECVPLSLARFCALCTSLCALSLLVVGVPATSCLLAPLCPVVRAHWSVLASALSLRPARWGVALLISCVCLASCVTSHPPRPRYALRRVPPGHRWLPQFFIEICFAGSGHMMMLLCVCYFCRDQAVCFWRIDFAMSYR